MHSRKLYLGAVWAFVMLAGQAYAQDRPQLFTPSSVAINANADSLLEPEIFLRGEIYDINVAFLQKVIEPQECSMSVFDLHDQTLRLRPLNAPSDHSKAWHGTFDGGELMLVLGEGAELREHALHRSTVVTGTLRTDSGQVFQLRTLIGRQVLLRQLDPDRLPDEFEPIVPAEEMPPVPEKPTDVAAAPYNFSVAVFYTRNARDGEGSTALMNSRIDLMVTETNEAYAKSNVNAKVSLVYRAETSDDESGGFVPMLKRLQNTSDGHMDEVHGKRDQYKADLVVLICEDPSECGRAYIMETESVAFDKWAFAVVNRRCATGYYSFAHEMGHNMGCCHDAANPCPNPIYPYAYGWHFNANGQEYRTIMAYKPGIRIQRISNPNVTYLGVATGSAGDAENYKTINNTADTVSAFRN